MPIAMARKGQRRQRQLRPAQLVLNTVTALSLYLNSYRDAHLFLNGLFCHLEPAIPTLRASAYSNDVHGYVLSQGKL